MAETTTETKMPPISELKGRKLGRILIKMGKVTRDQVQEALQLQKNRHAPVGQYLTDLGYIDEGTLNIALAAQQNMSTVDLDTIEIEADVLSKLPKETAQSYMAIPIEYRRAGNRLTVAIKSANNFRAVDDISMLLNYKVKAVWLILRHLMLRWLSIMRVRLSL